MACRYTYQGKTYEAHEFDDVLRAMKPAEASKYMGGVTSVPDAPMITDTKAWVGLALKRMIAYAVDNGFDKVAWANGEQNAQHYRLSRAAEEVSWQTRTKKGEKDVSVKLKNGEQLTFHLDSKNVVARTDGRDSARYKGTGIDAVIGKGLAEKVMSETEGRASGEGLNIGGEGMRAFYDQIVPQVARDVLRKVGGGQVEAIPFSDFESKNAKADDALLSDLGVVVDGARPATQQGFTITQEMKAKVQTEGLPLFSRARVFGDITAAQEQALRNTGLMTEPKTWAQRWAEFKTDLGKRVQTGMVDQFAAIKALDQQAYIKARMSKGSEGTLEAMMLYGKPHMNKGVPDVRVGQEGFAHVLAKLGNEQDRFFAWVAAQRAERLAQHGLENLFTQGDISALKTLHLGDAKNPNRAKLYTETLQQLNDFNDAVLAIAEESGIIDAKARQMFKDMPYVPFYRVMEDGVQGPTMSSGMVNQYAWKKLKGGSAKLNEDLIANTLQNWAHLFSAAAKNRASLATMDACEKVQIAEQVPSGTKGAVKVLRNGVTEHWLISDPYIAEAVSAMEYVAPQWFKPFSTAKRWLTAGVTFSPVFKIRNLIRDSISAIGQGELSYNPISNVLQGVKLYRFGTQTHASMLAGGGSIHFGTAEDSSQLRKQIRKWSDEGTYLDEPGWRKFSDKLVAIYDAYQDLGDKSENANRAALYEQLLKKGYSQEDALFMSRDLLDFSMSGRWPVVRFLAQTVPFLNARLQGLYKLGRAAQDNPARLGYVVGAVIMASMALMLGQEDDDWWKEREDWDRDANWAFKVGGIVFRIPKPFEIGSIGTVAERSWELFFNKEMDAKRYGKRISDIFLQTFSMNPVPQAIKPFADVYANQDAFSGKPIESMGLERLRPEDRKTNRTTTMAEFLGLIGLPDPAQLMMGRYRALSPVQMDYLARAYFGWTGTAALTVVDQLTRPMLGRGERPEGTLKDTFLIGNFASDATEGGSSRYVTAMYDQAKGIEQAYASYRDALKRGDTKGAADIFEEEKDKIRRYKMVENQKKLISGISQRIKRIESMPNLSGEEKRAQIIKMEQTRNRIARQMAGA
jgi:hypothetical protein